LRLSISEYQRLERARDTVAGKYFYIPSFRKYPALVLLRCAINLILCTPS